MLNQSKRILILSSNTGGGHQSAASALHESFMRLSPAGQVLVNVSQVLEEAHFLTRKLADFYNYLLRYHQHYMHYYYNAIQRIRPYESNILFELSRKYGTQLFERLAPNMLVSVHPMTQHFFAYILKQLRLTDKIPLITVVTDPCAGFWNGWACQEVSQYYVASEGAKAQLIEYGIPDERIDVSGMPVHARFQPIFSYGDKQQLRQALGLHPDRFTVLINSGWAGGGNIPALFETLIHQSQGLPIQLVFLAGHNDALYAEAKHLIQNAPFPAHVVGFADNIQDYMNAADVMVSKLGGLTTFEAMACHLPVLADCLTQPMPQEAGTARLIDSSGAGTLITYPDQLLNTLDQLIRDPDHYQAMRLAAAQVGRPNAVDHITQNILHYGI